MSLQPLSDPWALQELLVKATPLALIAIGLSYCFRANLWNIGAEGQYVIGAVLGSWLALRTHGTEAGFWVLPLMLLLGIIGGALYGLIPAFLKTRFGVNEILTSLMLVYVAQLILDYLVRGPWRDPKGFNFPQSVTFDPSATLPPIFEGGRVHYGAVFALIAVLVTAVVLGRTLFGYRLRLTRRRAARRAVCRLQLQSDDAGGLRDLGRAGGACRHLRGVGPDRPAAAVDFARLRLHGHHRGVPRPAQPHRHPGRGARGGAHLHRRRERADPAEAAARSHPGLPGHPAALRAGRRRAGQLPHSFRQHGEGRK